MFTSQGSLVRAQYRPPFRRRNRSCGFSFVKNNSRADLTNKHNQFSCFRTGKRSSKNAALLCNAAFLMLYSFEIEIFRFWLSEKRRRRRKRRSSIFTTPKRKRSRGAAAERTPVGTRPICSGAALQALEIDPLCLRTCALLRNKYGPFGLFDRSASALRAIREREGTHTAWYASRRDMTVSQSRRSAAALFSRSTPFKTDWFLIWRQLSAPF